MLLGTLGDNLSTPWFQRAHPVFRNRGVSSLLKIIILFAKHTSLFL